MPRAVGYAYPWDYVGDDAAARRAVSAGVDSVALAASYHSTRAATPLHPDRRIFEAQRSACCVPVREQAWRGQRLIPVVPDWDPGGHAFGDACRQLGAAGLPVEAWIVLTHNGALRRAHPDLVVRNAFGDAYPYALCPSAHDVQEYCLTLVEEILACSPVDGIVLEACGPMGLDHGGSHEKTEFAAWDDTRRTLLSLCFCGACRLRYAAAGVDCDELAGVVRAGIDATSGTIEDCLGEGLARAVVTIRTAIALELRTLVVGRARSVRPGTRITVHGSHDPWATGSFSTLLPAVGEGVDGVVASCWDVPGGGARIQCLRALAASGTEVGAYLRFDRDWPPGEATERRLREYLAAGMRELHLYHLGLLGHDGLARLREVVGTARRLEATPS